MIINNCFTRKTPKREAHRRVVDVRGGSDFSRFDSRPERPHFSNFGPPTERRPGGGGGVFVAQNRRTLAELTPSDCKRPTLAGFVPLCARHTLVDLTPKVPHFSRYYPPVTGRYSTRESRPRSGAVSRDCPVTCDPLDPTPHTSSPLDPAWRLTLNHQKEKKRNSEGV